MFEVGVVSQDFLDAHARSQKFEQVLDRVAEAADGWLPWQTNGSTVIRSSRVIPTAYGPLRITSSRLASFAAWVRIAAANRWCCRDAPGEIRNAAAIRARTALAEACCGLTVTTSVTV